jgi:hypothetical protein
MPLDLDGYIIDKPGHFYGEPHAGTGGSLFNALRPYYATTEAMNQAIGREWKAMNYEGLRLGAARRLLLRKLAA